MKITKTRLKEIIREELLKEGRDTLIKKQAVKTPFGDLKFEVWEVMSGPGSPAMLSFDIEFNGTTIQKLNILCVQRK